MQVNARRLLRSACVGVFALVLAIGVVAYTAKAANYTANLSTAVNWTATATAQPSAIWNCATTGTNDTCGVYPGQLALPAGLTDLAVVTNSGGNGPLSVTTNIPNPVRLNIEGGTVDIGAGGQLTLAGTSTVAFLTGTPKLSISGGTLTNTGTLQVTSTGVTSSLDLNGGTLNGAGTTTVGGALAATFNVTGTQGAMTIDQQTVRLGGTSNFTASNTLSLTGGASVTNTTGATFNANGTGTMGGTGLFTNAGTLTKGSGAPFTVGAPFVNTSTASVFTTGIAMNFFGGSGGGGHNNATWTIGGPTGGMNFGGTHVLNGSETFTGLGTVTIQSGGGWSINTTPATLTLATGLNLVNGGSIDFGTAQHTLNIAGGSFNQGAAGVLKPKIGIGNLNGVSDLVTITGAGSLAGTLAPILAAGYTPVNGHSFTIMTCSGGCTTTSLSYTPIAYPGGSFQLLNTGTQVQLLAVATPADLAVTKTGPATLLDGQSGTYTVVVTNNGPGASTAGATLSDTITGGTSTGFSATAGMACSGTNPINCTLPSIPSGGTATLTVTIVPTAPGTLTNSATATDPLDGTPANNTATFSTAVTAAADLSFTGFTSTPATAAAGSTVTYTATASNLGPDPASNVTVSFNLTGGGAITGATAGAPFTCTFTAATASCTATTWPAGSPVTFTITATAPATAGTMTLTGNASSATTDPNTANNTSSASTAIGASADVGITKAFAGTATAGQQVQFTVTVQNFGPSSATNVVVSDPATAGLTFVSNSGACTTAYPCSLGTLTAGQTATITSTYTVAAAATSVSNTATVSATESDPNPGNNTSTVSSTVTKSADLSITKTAPATITAGKPATFTITVANAGPSDATGLTIDDTPAGGLTFVSATGACTSFPCSVASLPAGGTLTISATFNVSPTATSVKNTATVSAVEPDPNTANNTSTVTKTVGSSCPKAAPILLSPADGATNVPLAGNIQWTNVGANFYDVYLGPAGTGCATQIGTSNVTTSFGYSGLQPDTDYEARIVAREAGCTSLSSTCIHFHTAKGTPTCNLASPTLLSPANGAVVGSPITLRWSAVTGATSYHVVATVNGMPTIDETTPDTSLDITVLDGPIAWSVTALSSNCASVPSTGTFNVCSAPGAPLAGVVGAPTSGYTYEVLVIDPSPAWIKFEYQEATKADFSDAKSQTTTSPSVSFTRTIGSTAQVYFYRVRVFNACSADPGPFSKTLRVVIVPAVASTRPVLNVPVGTNNPVVEQLFVPGEDQPVSFTATADRPWVIKIDPSSGILPPAGKTLDVTIDPSQLPNGTFTATVIVTITPLAATKISTNGTTSKSSPITVNLVTPVVPVDPTAPTSESLIVPAVGHLVGINSQWRSDIRVYNASPQKLKYLLNFISPVSTDVKMTAIETEPGATTALDDIIHNWYGFGEVGDSASGMLEIRPIVPENSTPNAFSTIVSSRTYNQSAIGTLGQFIPAVPFANFISGGTRLSLQQVAQNDSFRTNFGVVEATGHAASVLLSMFSSAGTKLFDLPLALAGSEQKQLNGLLAQQGITSLADGRMEVQVTSGDGKITAYASVVDNHSLDPLFVPGRALDGTSSERYVVPGVADLNTGTASWRTDVRVFNSGPAAQTATLTFYPEGTGKTPLTSSITINPNEVKVLDNVLQSVFATHDVGGAMYVDTPGGSQLVVTGRTYNQTATGTLGQFIPAATPVDAIARAGRALNILQVEDSVRYRTNVGLTEMSGKPATVEISVALPDTKITPSIQLPLAANEFVQFPLSAFGLGNVYNARVSVSVVDGDGHVTAYGSVIDQATTAPTYVAAQ